MSQLSRRQILEALSGLGLLGASGSVFCRALADDIAQQAAVSPEMIANAEWVSGLELSESQRAQTARALQRLQQKFDLLRQQPLQASEAPTVVFHVAPPQQSLPQRQSLARNTSMPVARPVDDEELAFLPVSELATLIRTQQIKSVDLTKLYLKRLKAWDPYLHCVVTLTETLALEQAERADREIQTGKYRSPLHGIPWGAKDLIAYPGYPTTWGAEPFRNQTLSERATVAKRLDAAGAVLVAKLSLGALAWGDTWFGGITRNPWDMQQGSSGSSAGSASATAAGLVGFSLGSETLGSIISPCRRCGATGLRPTFGRVSRAGCMPLAWSMDKIGPITRSIEDCALVFDVIHGADGKDWSAVNRPFRWPASRDIQSLRIGYVDDGRSIAERPELKVFQDRGLALVPIALPQDPPGDALHPILNVEAACVFDQLTRAGVEEGLFRWPAAFREGQFTPAVEYLRAQRFRQRLMDQMEDMFRQANIDLYVSDNDLMITNFTGHPSVILRKEMAGSPAKPVSFTMTGQLFGEESLLAAAHLYEQTTGLYRKRPEMTEASGQ